MKKRCKLNDEEEASRQGIIIRKRKMARKICQSMFQEENVIQCFRDLNLNLLKLRMSFGDSNWISLWNTTLEKLQVNLRGLNKKQ